MVVCCEAVIFSLGFLGFFFVVIVVVFFFFFFSLLEASISAKVFSI